MPNEGDAVRRRPPPTIAAHLSLFLIHLSESRLSPRGEAWYTILVRRIKGMLAPWKPVVQTAEILLAAFGGFSVYKSAKEKNPGKHTLRNPWPLGLFFLLTGLFFTAFTFVRQTEAVLFAIFSLPSLFAALVVANQRVHWDDKGFRYRTVFRREVPYAFEDIRGMKAVGSSGGQDLSVRAEGRWFLLDAMALWQPFAAAYSNWLSRNGLPDWRKAPRRKADGEFRTTRCGLPARQENRQERFLERYRRHGPFLRKLDRIPGGYFFLALYTFLVSPLCLIGGLWVLLYEQSARSVLSGLCCLALSHFMGPGYVRAVQRLDDDPKLIRRYINRYSKIRPDPDAAPKTYRRKREE